MSKERALRRAARLAENERARAARERAVQRRARLRGLRPRLGWRGRRTGRLYPRRTRSQRAGIALVTVTVLAYIWLQFDSLAIRIALTALVVVAAPIMIVIILDRRM